MLVKGCSTASSQAGGTNTSPLDAAELRYRRLRKRIGRLVPSNYDLSDRCNLKCEGCLYFEGEDRLAHADTAAAELWEAFFASEAERGVNFAYLGGAEPSLEIDRLRMAARYIQNGVIFTNGTRLIPRDINYRIHVSIWGRSDESARLRGGDNVPKAMRLYAKDPRAVFVYTITRSNISDIFPAAKQMSDAGLKLTFSYFSPTTSYLGRLQGLQLQHSDYFRISTSTDNLILSRSDLARAREEIESTMRAFPQTIVYSLDYDAWITQADRYTLNDYGVATDCGFQKTSRHRHYGVDRSESHGKCCTPNIDCRECRAYAMGYASFLTRYNVFKDDPVRFESWLSVWGLWADMFMPLQTDHDLRDA